MNVNNGDIIICNESYNNAFKGKTYIKISYNHDSDTYGYDNNNE